MPNKKRKPGGQDRVSATDRSGSISRKAVPMITHEIGAVNPALFLLQVLLAGQFLGLSRPELEKAKQQIADFYSQAGDQRCGCCLAPSANLIPYANFGKAPNFHFHLIVTCESCGVQFENATLTDTQLANLRAYSGVTLC